MLKSSVAPREIMILCSSRAFRLREKAVWALALQRGIRELKKKNVFGNCIMSICLRAGSLCGAKCRIVSPTGGAGIKPSASLLSAVHWRLKRLEVFVGRLKCNISRSWRLCARCWAWPQPIQRASCDTARIGARHFSSFALSPHLWPRSRCWLLYAALS